MRPAALLCLTLAFVSCVRADDWTTLAVPGVWEADERFAKHDGFAWYRCTANVPEAWKDEDVYLLVEQVDNAFEVWVNGTKVGSGGALPPNYRNGLDTRGRFRLDAKTLRTGQRNLVAVRVYDADGKGGFKGPAPMLIGARDALVLKGDWQFRTGDDLAWARVADDLPADVASFRKLVPITELTQPTSGDAPGPLSPGDALKTLKTPDDLVVEQVLAEPLVAQPVFLTFDTRGRMWVVQYKQYPHPAGLTLMSRDQYWRAVYDKVPLPPPHGVRGKDQITIHEDTDGDGKFDRHRTFLDGLNIATACVPTKDGVWVLNPPYLLFYPDANGDDVPDGDPVVHLEGFGLEDTHSVVNSLCLGPDGWLYGAQGSTVTGNVRRPGAKTGVISQGQLIWRYHPVSKQYEVFAEGGGNAFGVEIDTKGRIFSGHNGGDTRGFHYQQGAYLQKGFAKHGPLSNPYAFGYFPPMPHHTVPRFTHTFVIYEGTNLPEKYHGKLFGVAPLLNHVVMSDVTPTGSTFRTQDIGYAITSSDPWFRPVDIKIGPDGALYIADWYDGQTNHYRNHEGQIDITNGRIYRLRGKDARPSKPANIAAKSTPELVALLDSPANRERWTRNAVLQSLGERKDPAVLRALRSLVALGDSDTSLAALWGMQVSGGVNEGTASGWLDHRDPAVRGWAVRLLGDGKAVSPETTVRLAHLAQAEPNVEVRAQLASTSERLPARDALPILRALWTHSEDLNDPRLPLLGWWALESKCDVDREAVLKTFEDSAVWGLPLVVEHILPRLMRRYAATGARRDLQQCAKLLALAPTEPAAAALLKGFEEAFRGRPMGQLPEELLTALAGHGGGSALLGVRLKRPEALAEALKTIADPKADRVKRIEFALALGDVRPPESLPAMKSLLVAGTSDKDSELLSAVLSALSGWNEPDMAVAILDAFPKLPPDAQGVALATLISRAAWTRSLLAAVEDGRVAAKEVPADIVRRMTAHRGEDIAKLIAKHWGEVSGATTEQMQAEIVRLKSVALNGSGSPYAGKKLFSEACGKCHRLHGLGGQIGPDLTTFKRDDLDNMLLNIVNPSAEIREGFETWLAADADGRVVSGFLVDQDPQTIVLRGAEGQTVTLARKDLDEFVTQRSSLMPEGLLKNLSEQQVRDLLAYLRSTQPLPE